eukprot:gene6081-7577_t
MKNNEGYTPFMYAVLNGWKECSIVLLSYGAEVNEKIPNNPGIPLSYSINNGTGVYTWKIENFSKIKDRKVYSNTFLVSGFTWKLVAYPRGSKSDDNLSLYLEVANHESLSEGWYHLANFTFIIINQLDTTKRITRDVMAHRFHKHHTDLGFSQILKKEMLKDKKSGWLVNDTLLIEFKIEIIQNSSYYNETSSKTFTWKMYKVTSMKDRATSSDFRVGGSKWMIALYPKGKGGGNNLSIYLKVADSSFLPFDWFFLVNFKFSIINQKDGSKFMRQVEGKKFKSTVEDWGFPQFMKLSALYDQNNGFINYTDDSIIMELQMEIINDFTKRKHKENPQEWGLTPLHWLSYKGSYDGVRILLTNGANSNVMDSKGRTPLDWCAYNGDLPTSEVLINVGGADVNCKDHEGYTPLHKAVMNGHLEVARLLVKYGANVNSKNNCKVTPLSLAILVNRMWCVESLVKWGADLNLSDKQGRSPLHWAVFLGDSKLLSLLIKYGCKNNNNNLLNINNNLENNNNNNNMPTIITTSTSTTTTTTTTNNIITPKTNDELLSEALSHIPDVFIDNFKQLLVQNGISKTLSPVSEFENLLKTTLSNFIESKSVEIKAIAEVIRNEGKEKLQSQDFQANVYYSLHMFDKCIDDCKEAIRKNTSGGGGYIYSKMADSYLAIGKYKESIECYQKAIDLEPNNETFKSSLSKAKSSSSINQSINLLSSPSMQSSNNNSNNNNTTSSSNNHFRHSAEIYSSIEDVAVSSADTFDITESQNQFEGNESILPDSSSDSETDSDSEIQNDPVSSNQKEFNGEILSPLQLNIRDQDGYTPLHKAIWRGKTSFVKLLIEKGADPMVRTKDNRNALHIAVSANEYHIAQLILDCSPESIHQTDDSNQTPLFKCVSNGNMVMLQLLLQRGANVNQSNSLHHHNSTSSINTSNSSITSTTTISDESSPINEAIKYGDISCIIFLLQNCADIQNTPKSLLSLLSKRIRVLKPRDVNSYIPECTLSKDMLYLLNNPNYKDITFIVEEKPIYAWKGILCARSDYFRAMFETPLKESLESQVEIKSISFATFLQVMEYLYTGSIANQANIQLEDSTLLFIAANRFMIPRLKLLCEKMIVKDINVDNLYSIFKLVDLYETTFLLGECVKYFSENFSRVVETNSILKIPCFRASLLDILRDSLQIKEQQQQ